MILTPKLLGEFTWETESALDVAKPTATYAVGAVDKIMSSKRIENCLKIVDTDLTLPVLKLLIILKIV